MKKEFKEPDDFDVENLNEIIRRKQFCVHIRNDLGYIAVQRWVWLEERFDRNFYYRNGMHCNLFTDCCIYPRFLPYGAVTAVWLTPFGGISKHNNFRLKFDLKLPDSLRILVA